MFAFPLQGKAPKEILAILTETLACFLPGRDKDLSAPPVPSALAFWKTSHFSAVCVYSAWRLNDHSFSCLHSITLEPRQVYCAAQTQLTCFLSLQNSTDVLCRCAHLHTPSSPLLSTIHLHFPILYLFFFQPTFTRRTSGHCFLCIKVFLLPSIII